MKIKAIFLSIFIVLSGQSFSWAENDGGLTGEFLNFGVGARPLGMGRAFTAVADDVDAVYWNPSGLATFRSSQISFQHNPLEINGAINYLGYTQPIYGWGNMAVALLNMDTGETERTVRINDDNFITTGSYEHSERAYLISYANNIGRKFYLGSTLKMVEIEVDSISERGFGGDLGSLFIPNERVRFGLMLRNIVAPTYSFQSEKENFPLIGRAGTAVNFFNKHLTAAFDLEKSLGADQDIRWNFGVEGHIIEKLVLRAGVNKTEISTGLGIRHGNIIFDYGAGFQDLSLQNRISVKYVFGGYDVTVKSDTSVFSPVGLKNKVTLRIDAANRSRIVKWRLIIHNTQDEIVRTFQGFVEPPEYIEWDGRDTNGNILPPGRYFYHIATLDKDNKLEKTPTQTIRIDSPIPMEIEAK